MTEPGNPSDPAWTLDSLSERLAERPHCRRFAEVWRQWRGDQLLPTRADADPVLLGSLLPAINILEVVRPDRIIFRLVATELEEFVGYSRKGQNFVDLAAPENRAERIRRHQNIIATPCGMSLVRWATAQSGVPLTMHALLFPVTEADSVQPRFIYFAMDIVRADDWYGTEVPTVLELADDIHYIDIGRGLPEHP